MSVAIIWVAFNRWSRNCKRCLVVPIRRMRNIRNYCRLSRSESAKNELPTRCALINQMLRKRRHQNKKKTANANPFAKIFCWPKSMHRALVYAGQSSWVCVYEWLVCVSVCLSKMHLKYTKIRREELSEKGVRAGEGQRVANREQRTEMRGAWAGTSALYFMLFAFSPLLFIFLLFYFWLG